MIDYNLITQNIKHASNAFFNLISTPSPCLFLIENVFTDELLSKLKKYVNNDQLLPWEVVENQQTLNRRKITWHQDTVIEEIHNVFSELTDLVNDKFPIPKKNFLGTSLWKDADGYTMSWHTDNPIIDVSIQVYLFNTALPKSGTVFKINNTDFLVPYVSNSGYVCIQTSEPNILHKPATVTSPEEVRYSIYSIWSKSTKKSPHA